MFHAPDQFRFKSKGSLFHTEDGNNNGVFFIPNGDGLTLQVVASDGMGWEHVSVSADGRCPTWHEMCEIKALFWDDDDCVIQFHPPKADYINNHPYCLHMWRPIGVELPRPPSIMVGV